METGYTSEEQKIADHIANAWKLYNKLENKHPSDLSEFHYAIHLLQQKLAMRILRRDYPEYFGYFLKEEKNT